MVGVKRMGDREGQTERERGRERERERKRSNTQTPQLIWDVNVQLHNIIWLFLGANPNGAS